MLYYNRIEVSEGIDIKKASASTQYDIYHYWYFLDKGFKCQPYAYNGCHDILMTPMNLSSIAISHINVKVLVIRKQTQ